MLGFVWDVDGLNGGGMGGGASYDLVDLPLGCVWHRRLTWLTHTLRAEHGAQEAAAPGGRVCGQEEGADSLSLPCTYEKHACAVLCCAVLCCVLRAVSFRLASARLTFSPLSPIPSPPPPVSVSRHNLSPLFSPTRPMDPSECAFGCDRLRFPVNRHALFRLGRPRGLWRSSGRCSPTRRAAPGRSSSSDRSYCG